MSFGVLALVGSCCALLPQQPAAAPAGSAAAAAQPIDQFAVRLGASTGIAVGRGSLRLHTSLHDGFDAEAARPLGAVGRWFTTATVLRLVDSGQLELDTVVSRYVAEFARDDKSRITLRQCLSGTAGFHADPAAMRRPFTDLGTLARALADHPLRNDPGIEFVDSDVGFAVAAIAAARRSGRPFSTLFRQQLVEPLGLATAAFPADAVPGTGALASLRDLERFFGMLAQRGTFEGVRVLSERSIEAMLRPLTQRMTVRSPSWATRSDHGVGVFVHELGDGTVVAMAAGDGMAAWLEPERGAWGIAATAAPAQRLWSRMGTLLSLQRGFLQSPAVAGHSLTVRLDHGGRERSYLLHLPPGAERSAALPLLLVLHDDGDSGERLASRADFTALAAQEGFAVAFPEGSGGVRGRGRSWNSAGRAGLQAVDDVGFLRAVVLDVRRRVAIDPRRTYAVGYGNGGAMGRHLASEEPGLLPAAHALEVQAEDTAASIWQRFATPAPLR